jgi:hypothetical protein
LLLLLQWLVSLLPELQDSTQQQQSLMQAASTAQQKQQQAKAASTAISTPQQHQAIQELLTSLLSESGVAAATDAANRHVHALVSTARQFLNLFLQLRPSLEQLLSIRDRVSLQQLLSLPPDDARVTVLMADHSVSWLAGLLDRTADHCLVSARPALVGP